MKKTVIVLVIVGLMAFASCERLMPLDLSVHHLELNPATATTLIIKNNETKSLTDVTITITPRKSGNEYYYNVDKIAAKERVMYSLSGFKDDGGNSFSGAIGKIKIECNQGNWTGGPDD